MTVTIRFLRLQNHELPVPSRQSSGSSGLDVQALLATEMVLEPGARALIPTGFAVELPEGYELQVRPRSGLALKHGVTIVNAPGTIDSDYRGEIGIILINLGEKPYTIQPGERIAQLVLQKSYTAEIIEVSKLEASDRGTGGFGSTGR